MKWSRESRSFSRKEQFCQAQLQKVRNSWCTESRRSPPFLSAFMAEAGLETALAFSLCAGALTGLVHILQGPEGKRPRGKNENMGPSRQHLSRLSTTVLKIAFAALCCFFQCGCFLLLLVDVYGGVRGVVYGTSDPKLAGLTVVSEEELHSQESRQHIRRLGNVLIEYGKTAQTVRPWQVTPDKVSWAGEFYLIRRGTVFSCCLSCGYVRCLLPGYHTVEGRFGPVEHNQVLKIVMLKKEQWSEQDPEVRYYRKTAPRFPTFKVSSDD